MPPDHDPGEELLQSGGWSRRTVVASTVAAGVVVVGLVIGLARGGHPSPSTQHASGPSAPASVSATAPAAIAGNDVVVQGSSYGFGTTTTAHHGLAVTATAALVSNADRTYSVLYPLAVGGVGKAVSVDDAEVAADDMNESLLVPTPLTAIHAAQRFELWIKLRISCGDGTVSFRSATVSIALAGTSAPAVFRFADLFGSDLNPRRRPC